MGLSVQSAHVQDASKIGLQFVQPPEKAVMFF